MILCDRFPTAGDDPQDPAYKFTRTSKDGRTGVFIPRTEGTGFDPIAFERRKREQEEERRRYLAGLMPEPTRDREIQEILARLTLTAEDRRRLNARGLPDDLIDSIGYRSLPNQWQPLGQGHDLTFGIGKGGNLKNHTPGILCPFQGASGAFVGAKVWNYDYQTNGQPKYYWLGRDGHKLPNGELPHAVYGADLATPGGVVALCEGLEIKPALAALALGIPVIGTNGSAFDSSPETLKQTLTTLGAQTVVFYPDAGAVINPNLPARYIGAADLIESFGLTVAFAWWGQTEKSAGDIDEISPEVLSGAVLLSPAEFKALCPETTRPETPAPKNAFAKWLERRLKRSPRRKETQPEIYAPGERLNTWFSGGDTLDTSCTGSGKSHDAAIAPPGENGGITFYIATDHRNPTVDGIRTGYADLWPRADHFWRWEDGKIVPCQEDDYGAFRKGYCPRASLFPALKDKGYAEVDGADNPICGSCPFAGTCKGTAGWYKADRRETFTHGKVRSHLESLPRDRDYSNDRIIFDEAERLFVPTRTLTATYPEFLLGADNATDSLDPQLAQTVYSAGKILKPLFSNQEIYGLDHADILDALGPKPENLGDLIEALEHTGPDFAALFTPADQVTGNGAVNAIFSEMADREAQEKLSFVPPAVLLPLLKAWDGRQGYVLRIQNGKLLITVDRRRDFDFLDKALSRHPTDATLTPEKWQLLTGCNRPLRHVAQDTGAAPLANLTILAIEMEGIGSNSQVSPAAIERIKAIQATSAAIHGPDFPVIGPKSLRSALDLNYWYFNHNRGTNAFAGNPHIMGIGLPSPNVGALKAEFQCLTGSLEGFQDHYDDAIQAEILQLAGRFRCQRYPDQNFVLEMIVPLGYDLSWLSEKGAKVQTVSAFEYAGPDAGTPSQAAKCRVIGAARDLIAQGIEVTQAAVAKALNVSQQAISKLMANAGLTLQRLTELLNTLPPSYTTAPLETLYRAGCITGEEYVNDFRWFLDLPPADIAIEALAEVKKGGAAFKNWLNCFPAIAQTQVLAILWSLISPDLPPPRGAP